LREFEFRWKGAGGGFRMLVAFNDLLLDEAANQYAANFVRTSSGRIEPCATILGPASRCGQIN